MDKLAQNPQSAPALPDFKPIRSAVVVWKNARQGHRIFFVETEDGISIVRILHTAMNWPDIIG